MSSAKANPQGTLAPPNRGTDGTWASTTHMAIIRAANSSFRRSRSSREASRQYQAEKGWVYMKRPPSVFGSPKLGNAAQRKAETSQYAAAGCGTHTAGSRPFRPESNSPSFRHWDDTYVPTLPSWFLSIIRLSGKKARPSCFSAAGACPFRRPGLRGSLPCAKMAVTRREGEVFTPWSF